MEEEKVGEWLTRHELSTYAAAFEEEGWDSRNQLPSIQEDDLPRLVEDVKMKSGHVARLRAALQQAQQQQQPPPPPPPPQKPAVAAR